MSEEKNSKIDYVKPEILDLGSAEAAYGDICTEPGDYADTGCAPGWQAQGISCDDGPGPSCSPGTNADT